MGGFATLQFGLQYPARARSLLVAGAGYGCERDKRERFRGEATAIAARLQQDGMAAFAELYAYGPTRVQFENRDPRGFAEFKRILAEHSATGSAMTQLGVQRERPSLYDLEQQLRALRVPMLVMTGDEDHPCLQPGQFLKQVVASAALLVIPDTGHTINLEVPEAFNAALQDLIELNRYRGGSSR